MMKTYIAIFLVLSCFINFASADPFSGGTGEPQTPYKISSLDDFLTLAANPSYWSSAFVLTIDIDLDGFYFQNSPIAPEITKDPDYYFDGTPFTGIFDGNSHTIANLTINNIEGHNYIGLFGFAANAQIKNLNIENVNIAIPSIEATFVGAFAGNTYESAITNCKTSGTIVACDGCQSVTGFIGTQDWGITRLCGSSVSITAGNDCWTVTGFVGYLGGGLIEKSYSTGAITVGSDNYDTAGLIGYRSNYSSEAIADCYSSCSISTGANARFVGGLIAVNYGNIQHCYSNGNIIVASGNDIGGLVGKHGYGTVTSCYWDTELSGQSTSAAGSPRIPFEMRMQSNYSGWDFESIWFINEGIDYPILQWAQTAPPPIKYAGGAGTLEDPYQIAEANDIIELSQTDTDWDKYFILTADINLAGYIFDKAPIAPDTNDYNWDFQGTLFTGSFNGNNFKIINLKIENLSGADFIGLFGKTEEAQIENLTLENVSIFVSGYDSYGYSSYYLGSLIGWQDYGLVNNCSAFGAVWGQDDSSAVGGLVGYCNSYYHQYTGLSDCSVSSDVSGGYQVGGISGMLWNCRMVRCSGSGSVDGSYSVGGLTGDLAGNIEQSYNSAYVQLRCYGANIGGCAGSMVGGSIIDSYNTGHVYAQQYGSNIGGLVGLLSWAQIQNCYSTGMVSTEWFVTDFGGLIGSNYQYNGTITASFWDIQSSGQEFSDGGTGLLTEQMKQIDTFADVGWDFSSIWSLTNEGASYPRLAWQPAVTIKYSGGSGTELEPYQLSNPNDLIALSQTPDDCNKFFILTADIDLIEYIFDNALIAPDTNNSEYDFQGTPFTGTFDGDGHKILNFLIFDSDGRDYLGLFGKTQNATVKDLTLENLTIYSLADSYYIGGLVAWQEEGLISNCRVDGIINAQNYEDQQGYTSSNVGGLVGRANGPYWQFLMIEKCSAVVYVKGNYDVGGLVGGLMNCAVAESSSGGNVEGNQYVGGLIGEGIGSVITKSFSTVNVYSTLCSFYVGGLIGLYIGDMSDCYALGNITVSSYSQYIGGLIGYAASGSIINCYSASRIIGDKFDVYDYGGLIGINGCTVANSFWDFQTSTVPFSAAGTGKSKFQMMNQSTFEAWDFVEDETPAVWVMLRPSSDYPRLAWQQPIPGDIAGKFGVDHFDIKIFSLYWLESDCFGNCDGTDLNSDGVVDFLDFALIAKNWLRAN